MKVNVPICPISGSSVGVLVNGAEVIQPVEQKVGFLGAGIVALTEFFKILAKVSMVIFEAVFSVVEFFVYLIIWREPGSKGFCAGLCRQREKSLAERKAQKALQLHTGPFGTADSWRKSTGATSEELCARAELTTVHHVMDGPGGMKLKLTLFPQFKTVHRRIAVPYKNAKNRISYSHTQVVDIEPAVFSDSFKFCLENVVLVCNHDISNGLFNQHKAVRAIPVIDMGTEKVAPVAPAAVQPTLDLTAAQPVAPASVNQEAIALPTKQAQGLVAHMGVVSKKFGDKPAYQTYEVVIRKSSGEEVSFVGQQLQDKAHAGAFKLGDHVEIIQGKVQLQKTTEKGKTFKNTSNVFTIKVLQPA